MVRIGIIIAATCIGLSACNRGTNDANVQEAIGNETAGQPVETRKPGTDYKPAFSGQTRAPGVKTSAAYQVQVLAESLTKPWDIATMPDGRFLVTEKEGTMRIVTASGQVSEKIGGIPEVVAAGQGGLLGLALDPDFGTSRMVYWTFTEKRGQGNLAAVAKGKLSADERRIENAQVIYRAEPAYDGNNHYGSRLVFDKSGNLYVTFGERFEKERRANSQNPGTAVGTIVRINKDGQPAAGNPFASQAKALPEVYSIGHRSPQGIDIHPETGDLWMTEMGPKGGDELNLIQPGKNYGWPVITYGLEYSGEKVGAGITQREGMEQPTYYWDPVLSPSGMTFYQGSAIPEWKNNLFICGLNSYHIARLVLENRKVVGEERLAADQQQRFRDIAEGKDGALYAVTDAGRLYRIGKSAGSGQ
ncbi:PQQ-dependent sugar dehydrogenase [Hymenobacter koreensis]|uniref:PQQ-dependent sugar dehydrogenase n=1 Tax=Hymenobacter koreensis TaxID=1084523 RepID=A0ABP8IU04_9BACT